MMQFRTTAQVFPPWQDMLAEAIASVADLRRAFPGVPDDEGAIAATAARYPLFINPYYGGLLGAPGSPLWKQVVPDGRELLDAQGVDDPLAEDALCPAVNITHRYPHHLLFLVSSRCAVYCRFCTRKRKIGRRFTVSEETIAAGLAYIRATGTVREVLLSGGDPLLLEDDRLADILHRLRAIRHVEIIRIGTRVPCVLPMRVTADLARTLARFHPLYINTHFNHPDEITPQAARACGLLADAGIPLGCQTVLLRGVNDSPAVMRALMQKLLRVRVRPYYLHQMDHTRGTRHFRTPLRDGLRIIAALRGRMSGMGVPQYVVDLPGGGGKVPLTPQHIVGAEATCLLIKNYCGDVYRYEVLPGEIELLQSGIL
jgi:lysine 2,3-aminomutase